MPSPSSFLPFVSIYLLTKLILEWWHESWRFVLSDKECWGFAPFQVSVSKMFLVLLLWIHKDRPKLTELVGPYRGLYILHFVSYPLKSIQNQAVAELEMGPQRSDCQLLGLSDSQRHLCLLALEFLLIPACLSFSEVQAMISIEVCIHISSLH